MSSYSTAATYFISIIFFACISYSCNSTNHGNSEIKDFEPVEIPDPLEPCDPIYSESNSDDTLVADSIEAERLRELSVIHSTLELFVGSGSNWKPKVDTIQASAFDHTKIKKLTFKPRQIRINSDSILDRYIAEYPNTIIQSDTCCVLKTTESEFMMCNQSFDPEDKGLREYQFSGVRNDYLIFNQSGYESLLFILFQPKNKKLIVLQNSPIFLNDKYIYAFGNYYGEGQFEMYDLENNLHYGFDTFGWTLLNFYEEKNVFFMEFRSERGMHVKKYLKISV